MRSLRTALLSTAVGAAALLAVVAQPAAAGNKPAVAAASYKHVLLISVDGMHSVDLTKWIETHPASTLAYDPGKELKSAVQWTPPA